MLFLEVQKGFFHITFNNDDQFWALQCLFLFVCCFFSCFVILFIALLPRVSTYLAPLRFHFVRTSFSFPAMSHSMDNFFLQSACADGIKKKVVDTVTVVNDFWSCFIEQIYARTVLLRLFLTFQAFLIWRRCWFKNSNPV